MKGKMRNRVIASVMALLMVVGLLPTSLVGGNVEVKAATTTYVFDAATELGESGLNLDKNGVVAAGTKFADYFVMGGEDSKRANSNTYAVEIKQSAASWIQFEAMSAADVTIEVSSTGGSNTSAVGMVDANGAAVAEDNGVTTAYGTSPTTVLKYTNVAAGTYKIVSPDDEAYPRGVRVLKITVEEIGGGASTTTEHVLSAEAELGASGLNLDKNGVVAAGTKFADYFTMGGEDSKRANSNTYAIEIKQSAASWIQFEVAGSADIEIEVSSTGGSNTSAVGMVDANGTAVAEDNGVTTVTGTSPTTVLKYTNVAAGTYKIVSPDDEAYPRGVRVLNVKVTEVTNQSVTTSYKLESEVELGASGLNLDKNGVVASGTKFVDYFTMGGEDSKRANSNTYAIEIKQSAASWIQFTVTGTASASIEASSTGGSNTSAIALLKDGEVVAEDTGITTVTGTSPTTVLNYSNLAAGTYKIVSPDDQAYPRGVRILNVEVTETTGGARPPRADWATLAGPVIGTPSLTDKNTAISVPYEMAYGYDGADSITVVMTDAAGNEIASKGVTESKGSAKFTPTASGTYSFKVIASRKGETDKVSSIVEFSFVLPLVKPVISSATSAGKGNVSVVWAAVPEAESYEVYCSGALAGTTTATSYTVSGLTIGTKYAFTVVAVRGAEKSEASDAVETTATEDAKTVWGFTRYGSSTNEANNGYEGGVNETGVVTVYSEGGKGKVVPNSTDGLAFYYTAVPTTHNFTLKAKVHVDGWKLSNGQEGFGLLATDRLGENGNTNPIWNNQYMALASKIEYYWDSEEKEVSYTSGTKYTMKLGIGVIEKSGVTQANLPLLDANDTATVQNEFKTFTKTLDTTPVKENMEAGTYNIIGNGVSGDSEIQGTLAEITDFYLEIQKNNTGYFITYYDEAGNELEKLKYYDPTILNNIDEENVYVGFFASRNARATFSDIQFSTILASEDAPAEEKPVELIKPTITIQSADVSNTEEYTLSLVANVAGTADVKVNDEYILTGLVLEAEKRLDYDMILPNDNKNNFVVYFYPDPNQVMEEGTALASTDRVKAKLTVDRNVYLEDNVNIYVAPWGTRSSRGTRNNPVDVYTAVDYARPGQTIIIMEGEYLLEKTIRIERGIDGTAENPIRMVVDPEATSRPVFDFQWMCPGMIMAGDYWYFNGFDVTHSQNAQKGIQVSGNNNTLDNICAYFNGNTGIQISRLFSTDEWEDWPANNLILNCTSYGNADAGYEDADGFAAKLTVADGNVFDGCVAFNNADDGWDLYAKVETGPIGKVVIKNSVAFLNGYLGDGTDAGNGNGFKMGGDSLTGYHELINSYAFYNKAKGIDSNSCPDIQVTNCTSYNNESYNVAFYTNNAANTDFAATGIISFKDQTIKSGYDIGEQHKPVGTQDTSKYLGDTNYYWFGTQSNNASGTVVTADWFKSLTFVGVTRNLDGTINMHGFLELTDLAASGVGAAPGGTPSQIITILPDPVKPDVDDGDGYVDGSTGGESVNTGDATPVMPLIVVMLVSAAVCMVYAFRRKRA